MNLTQIETKSAALRGAIKQSMDTMSDKQTEWKLPDVGQDFRAARNGLDQTEFNVVVCGEVKRGKSTLVNAILGRELLPTGVQETTCQVFRVSNGPESYKLVFDDGHEEPITAAELVTYGSQVAADQAAMPLLAGRSLKWIDVQVPDAKFLPKGVYLVDTPGLGATYAAHSLITNKFVAQADAVVFVFDTGRPIVEDEMRFLEMVFQITPHVMFVQSKIDQFGDTWQGILNRNKELLTKKFGRPGETIEIYPISSTNLFKAAQEPDERKREGLLGVSRFKGFKEQLELTSYRIAAWLRCAIGLSQSCRYHANTKKWFDEQDKSLSTQDGAAKKKFAEDKAAAKKKFETDWGKDSAKRKEILGDIKTILNAVKVKIQALNSDTVYLSLKRRIENLESLQAAQSFAENLPKTIVEAVSAELQSVLYGAELSIGQKLDSYSMSYPGEIVKGGMDLDAPELKQASWFTKIRNGKINAVIGGGLGYLLADLFLTGGLTTFIAIVGSTILGWVFGEKDRKEAELERQKTKLKDALSTGLMKVKNAIILPDPTSGKNISVLDEELAKITDRTLKAIGRLYEQKRETLERQIEQLEALARMSEDERQKAKEELHDRSAEWQIIGEGLVLQTRAMQELQGLLTLDTHTGGQNQ